MIESISYESDFGRSVQYSPILIQFVKPLLRFNEQKTEDVLFGTGNKIEIQAPVSANNSYIQTFPSLKSVLQIPTDGILRFKLIPSSIYTPNGRYQILYYESNGSLPIHEEEWIVPSITKKAEITITHSDSEDGDPVPEYGNSYAVFEILNINHDGKYKIKENRIKWLENPPNIGQAYKVTFVPALTLKHLKVATHEQRERGWTH